MIAKTCLAALAPIALLAACTTQTASPPPPAQPATPVQPATVAQCGLPQTSASTCQRNPNRCHVYVFGNAAKAFVYPHTLVIPSSGPYVIVWHLLDPGAVFRDAADGPSLGGNAEFAGGGPTDDPDGAVGSGGPGRRYRMLFLNQVRGQSHQYAITFKTPSGAIATCDPRINNQTG